MSKSDFAKSRNVIYGNGLASGTFGLWDAGTLLLGRESFGEHGGRIVRGEAAVESNWDF